MDQPTISCSLFKVLLKICLQSFTMISDENIIVICQPVIYFYCCDILKRYKCMFLFALSSGNVFQLFCFDWENCRKYYNHCYVHILLLINDNYTSDVLRFTSYNCSCIHTRMSLWVICCIAISNNDQSSQLLSDHPSQM